MREIEFRGKESFNDNWAYGDLIKRANYYTLFREEFKINKDQTIAFNEIEKTIRPYTVGQYTGLKDKNGTKIFEGDIFEIYNTKYFVEFDSASFAYKEVEYINDDMYGGCPFDDNERGMRPSDIEVIGNIYDNPELLGGDNGI